MPEGRPGTCDACATDHGCNRELVCVDVQRAWDTGYAAAQAELAEVRANLAGLDADYGALVKEYGDISAQRDAERSKRVATEGRVAELCEAVDAYKAAHALSVGTDSERRRQVESERDTARGRMFGLAARSALRTGEGSDG